jgi:TP901 family phage tail tape measure protein
MAIVGELVTVLLGNNTQLMASVAQSEAALKGYSSTASNHHSIVAGAAHAAGVAMLATGAVAAVGLGFAAKSAGDFQEQMAIINTIAHQTPEELTKTGDSIRAMAQSTGEPLSTMTKAFYDLLSAGVPAGQAMAVLKDSTTLAIGGLATTEQTVDLLTSAINSYHLNTAGAAKATDQFALAVQDGKLTADQIASTFADVAPLASQMHVGIDEIAASYAVLTARGTPAAETTTQMNRAMVEMLKPNADLNDLQEKTHLNFAKIAGEKGVVVALQEMREAAEKNNVPFQDLFGRLDGFKFALATTGPNFAAYATELEKMHHANGTAAAQAEERMGTFHRQTAILGETFGNLLITVGTPLLPFLTDLVSHISAGVDAVGDWIDTFPNLGAALASIPPHLAAVANDFVGRIPQMAQAFAGWIAPMIPVALAQLGDFAGQIGAWISAQAPGWLAQVQTWAGAFIGWIGPMIPPALAALGDLASQVAAWIVAQAPAWLDQLGVWASAFVDWIGPMIETAIGALGDLATRVVAWIGAQDWAGAIQKWAGIFIDWIGPMVGRAIDALGALATQVITWLGQQIGPIGAAAIPIGAAIANAVVGALGKLPGLLGDAIGNATKNFDASKIPGNLATILGGTAILGAVAVAGQAVGAAYAMAMAKAAAVVDQIKTLLSAALKAEQAAISTAVGVVGGVVGSAFQAAFSFAATALSGLLGVFRAALTPVAAEMALAAGPIGSTIGVALDAGIATGIALGPAVIGVALLAAVTAAAAKLGPQFVQPDVPGGNEVGPILGYADGGWVGLHGPQMAMVGENGPEYIVPNHQINRAASRSGQGQGGGEGGTTHVHNYITVQIDGDQVAKKVDERLFNTASGFNSGFTSLPGTTGA